MILKVDGFLVKVDAIWEKGVETKMHFNQKRASISLPFGAVTKR